MNCPKCRSLCKKDKNPSKGIGTRGNIFDSFCKKCDMYYCSQWKIFGFDSFKDSAHTGRYIRMIRKAKENAAKRRSMIKTREKIKK